MDNITDTEMDDMDDDSDAEEMEDEEDDAEPTPAHSIIAMARGDAPWTKDAYKFFVENMSSAADASRQLYEHIGPKVQAFDKELARRLKACQDAEDEVVRYCRSKLETR